MHSDGSHQEGWSVLKIEKLSHKLDTRISIKVTENIEMSLKSKKTEKRPQTKKKGSYHIDLDTSNSMGATKKTGMSQKSKAIAHYLDTSISTGATRKIEMSQNSEAIRPI